MAKQETKTAPDSQGGAENPIIMDAAERSRGVVRTSTVGIVANVLLAVFKALVGFASNSIAIVLDAVNNLSDAASSIITIVGTKLAGKKPDRDHPYGHGRIEYLTNIIIAVIVLWAGITSLQESIERIINPETADYSTLALVIVAVAVVAKILLGLYTKKRGETLNSGSLVASGTDALMDSVISAATLVAAFVYLFAGISLEAWLGAIISVVIIKAGFDILHEAIVRTIGKRVDPAIARKVKDIVRSVDGVLGAYDLILDDYGPDRLQGSVHVEVHESMNAVQIDALTRAVQQKVYLETGVILHTVGIYSVNEESPVAVQMRSAALEYEEANPYILEIHGLFVNEKQRIVTLDIVVSFEADDREKVRADMLHMLQEKFPEYTFTITLDSDISD